MRYSKKIFVLCLVAATTFICAACAGVADKYAKTSGWNSYADDVNHFRFSYPKDWEVIDEGFYKTHYGLTIQRIGREEDSNNWIRINSPQFSVEDGRCCEVDEQQICTYSQNATVIEIFENIVASFQRERE
jgi:hypothetical protein